MNYNIGHHGSEDGNGGMGTTKCKVKDLRMWQHVPIFGNTLKIGVWKYSPQRPVQLDCKWITECGNLNLEKDGFMTHDC